MRHPLKYMITWSFGHVLREYMVKVRIIKEGIITEVDATSGRESFRFKACGMGEVLECAITPGMPSFLYTMPQLKSFAEKTIRWPSHWQAIDTLKETGILNLDPFEFKGTIIKPRDFFLSLVEPKLRPMPGDQDVCVMWNTAIGQDKRVDYYMWAKADTEIGLTSMARVTGLSAAIGTRLAGRDHIREKGIVAPEKAISGELYHKFMNELAKREIRIIEVLNGQ